MTKKSFRIHIPTPCNEDFGKMTPKKKGRYCNSCEKVVTDFTQMSDRQIAKFIKDHQGNLCGRFFSNQLNRAIPTYTPHRNSFMNKAAGLILSTILSTGTIIANDSKIAEEEITLVMDDIENEDCDKEENNPINLKIDSFDIECIDPELFQITAGFVMLGDISTIFGPKNYNERKVTNSLLEKRNILRKKDFNMKSFFDSEKVSNVEETEIHDTSEHPIDPVRNETTLPPPISAINNVFPNPFIDYIDIDFFSERDGEIQINIFEESGKNIYFGRFDVKTGEQILRVDLNTSFLEGSVFILNIQDVIGHSHSHKLMRLNGNSWQFD